MWFVDSFVKLDVCVALGYRTMIGRALLECLPSIPAGVRRMAWSESNFYARR